MIAILLVAFAPDPAAQITRGITNLTQTAPETAALAAIRTFAKQDNLLIEYQSTSTDPNFGGRQIEVYQSGNTSYYVDPASNRVVGMMAGPALADVATGDVEYTLDQLQAMAISFLVIHSTCFSAQADVLRFERGSKKQNVFFRWDSSSLPSYGNLAPFIQVGITTGGIIFSYTDSICQ